MSGVRIPAGAPKRISRLSAGDSFFGRSRGVEVYPRQGKSPLEHQKIFPRLLAGEYFFRSLPGSRSLFPIGEIPAEHQNRENQQSIEIAGFSLFINALRRFWKAFRREKRRGFTTVFRIMQAHFANKMLTACGDQGPNPAGVLFIGRDFLRRLAHGVDNGLAVPSSKESK